MTCRTVCPCVHKPHLMRAGQWLCMPWILPIPDLPAVRMMGFGATPVEAYRDYLARNQVIATVYGEVVEP
jgi:hypothetical protein